MIKWISERVWSFMAWRRAYAYSYDFNRGYRQACRQLGQGKTPLWWDDRHPFDLGIKRAIEEWKKDAPHA